MRATPAASGIDIIITSPENDFLMVVEVKNVQLSPAQVELAIAQLKRYMVSTGCMLGLLVFNERLVMLRDSFEQSDGSSITILGEANLPTSLLPPSDRSWSHPSLEFESRVQCWLESLKSPDVAKRLPSDIKTVFSTSVLNIFRFGDVRAAGPRWSKSLA